MAECDCVLVGATSVLRWEKRIERFARETSQEMTFLQQAWSCEFCGKIEWRDVETVIKEEEDGISKR